MIDIDTITADSMASNEALIRDYLKTAYPSLDTSPGTVISELVVKPAAALYAAQDANLSTILSQFSLSLVSQAASPDMDMAKTLASNYRVTPRGGSKGAGVLSIYTTLYTNTYIYADTVFTAGGLQVKTSKTYIGIVADTLPETESGSLEYRKAVQLSAGLYVFTVPVVTVDNTSATISAGQSATMENQPAYITRIEVASAVTGGSDSETAKQLADRALYGVTAVVPSGSAHIASLFSSIEGVNIFSQKAFGLGDAEMLRDRNNISGISMGGRTDVYCKTAALPSSVDIVVTASRSSLGSLTWTANVDNTAAPGFYYIRSVTHTATGQSLDGEQVRVAYRAAPAEGGPAVPDAVSARYSLYQAATVQFEFSGLPTLSEQFILSVAAMPSIDVLQNYINSRAVRNEAQDVLVKAPVPNRIGLWLVCTIPPGLSSVSAEDVRTAAVNAVNGTEIGRGFLSAADIVQAVQSAVPGVVVAFPMPMTNTVYMPDGSVFLDKTDIGQIQAKEDLEQGVSTRNSVFICEARDVGVTFKERETIT